MKQFKYIGILLLSTLCTIAPIIGLGIWYFLRNEGYIGIVLGGAVGLIGFALSKPLSNIRIKIRKDVEYDEFGRSKTKGSYERLSKKERDAIDLQKTMDMERIMDSSAIAKITKEGSKEPDKDLEELVGLKPVKEKTHEMVARMQFENENNKNKKKNERTNSMSGRHMIFYGNPGTGKTTLARILTGFLFKYGYIKKNKCVEIDGNFLKAGSSSALKTELVVRQAYDGVLFIDEAYALMESGDGSGEQAIATLIKQMEDHRDKFILILAGYTKEMKMLLDLNPGFESRIKEYLNFPDYDDVEMVDIFNFMAESQGYKVKETAIIPFLERIDNERMLPSFGNARTVRNILDESLDKHALNFIDNKLNEKDRYVICSIGINSKVKRERF